MGLMNVVPPPVLVGYLWLHNSELFRVNQGSIPEIFIFPALLSNCAALSHQREPLNAAVTLYPILGHYCLWLSTIWHCCPTPVRSPAIGRAVTRFPCLTSHNAVYLPYTVKACWSNPQALDSCQSSDRHLTYSSDDPTCRAGRAQSRPTGCYLHYVVSLVRRHVANGHGRDWVPEITAVRPWARRDLGAPPQRRVAAECMAQVFTRGAGRRAVAPQPGRLL